jgi:hypothetical protein
MDVDKKLIKLLIIIFLLLLEILQKIFIKEWKLILNKILLLKKIICDWFEIKKKKAGMGNFFEKD